MTHSYITGTLSHAPNTTAYAVPQTMCNHGTSMNLLCVDTHLSYIRDAHTHQEILSKMELETVSAKQLRSAHTYSRQPQSRHILTVCKIFTIYERTKPMHCRQF